MKCFIGVFVLCWGLSAMAGGQDLESITELNDLNAVEDVVSNGQRVFLGDISQTTVALRVFGKHLCSGTIIAKNLVLTAAHCLENIPRAGLIQVVNEGQFFSHVASDFKIHPKYQKQKIYFGLGGNRGTFDVALVRVEIPFSPSLRAAILPDRELHFEKEPALIAGFGRTSKYSEDQGVLRVAETLISDSQYENQIYQSGKSFTCPGDSGGPVYLRTHQGKLMVVGIHAWGNCDNNRGFSESVSKYLPWLLQTIRELRSLRSL